jgi:hypothetical protein
VTKGTRPKKPSSSRGFAREARGASGVWGFWGFWGLKTKNQKLKIEKNFSLSKLATTTKKYLFIFFRVCADAPCFTPGNFKKDATVRLSHGRPCGHRPIVRPSVRKRPRDNPGPDDVGGRPDEKDVRTVIFLQNRPL